MTPRKLTRDRVLYAGIGVVEDLGVGALDLVHVARALHVLPSTLQRFIPEPEVQALVVDHLLSDMPSISAGKNWSWHLESWARRTRQWVVRYPGMAWYLSRSCLERAETLDVLEVAVALVGQAGVPEAERFNVAHGFVWFVLGRAGDDEALRGEGTAPDALLGPATPRLALASSVRGHLGTDPEIHFNTSVRVMLDGIAKVARRHRVEDPS
ncbi:MAG TPA: TetR/AcrR family transcriptional regulator C-terminal domain-containing protein [Acidimicrobiales bacterium]|nr:TetR/AcrR family transcriptional regulator C-terminal domain-containing protein [Acidimicrobiales bacterium]